MPAIPDLGYSDGWNMTPDELRYLSPAFHHSQHRIDILHSVGDDIVPYIDSLLWSRRDPENVHLHVVEDPHIGGPTYDQKLKLAFDLLRGRGELRRRLGRVGRRIPGSVRGRLGSGGSA